MNVGPVVDKFCPLANYEILSPNRFCCKQFPGPNEEGLAFLREKTRESPRCNAVWKGAFGPSLVLKHSETIANVIRTSGISYTAQVEKLKRVVCFGSFAVNEFTNTWKYIHIDLKRFSISMIKNAMSFLAAMF